MLVVYYNTVAHLAYLWCAPRTYLWCGVSTVQIVALPVITCHCAAQHITAHHSRPLHSTAYRCIALCSIAEHSTSQHCVAQHSICSSSPLLLANRQSRSYTLHQQLSSPRRLLITWPVPTFVKPHNLTLLDVLLILHCKFWVGKVIIAAPQNQRLHS